MYTVQVLLSTYNGEAYLKEQLDSILNQKNVAVKLFVRDDGSSDGTVDILRAYAALHDNICYLCGENCGVVASFSAYLNYLIQTWISMPSPIRTMCGTKTNFPSPARSSNRCAKPNPRRKKERFPDPCLCNSTSLLL